VYITFIVVFLEAPPHGLCIIPFAVYRPGGRLRAARTARKLARRSRDTLYFRAGAAEPSPGPGKAPGRRVVPQEPGLAAAHTLDAARATVPGARRGVPR